MTATPPTVELGVQHNYNSKCYQIMDFQADLLEGADLLHAASGLPGTRLRRLHLPRLPPQLRVDINSRFEWYKDVDGGGYPGGFGIPHTDYYEMTLGLDYHPTKWVQFRPEIRYDHATNPAFGSSNDKKNQLSIAAGSAVQVLRRTARVDRQSLCPAR